MTVCVCVRLTVAVMLLLFSMIAAEYLLEGMVVALDSRVCADSFSNLQDKNVRQFPSASRLLGITLFFLGSSGSWTYSWSSLTLYQS